MAITLTRSADYEKGNTGTLVLGVKAGDRIAVFGKTFYDHEITILQTQPGPRVRLRTTRLYGETEIIGPASSKEILPGVFARLADHSEKHRLMLTVPKRLTIMRIDLLMKDGPHE